MNRNNNKTKKQSVNKRSGPSRGNGGFGPPQIMTNIRKTHRFRFVSTTAGEYPLTPTFIFGASGTIATVTNTTVTAVNRSLKIKSIEVWSPPATQGSAATCSLVWYGAQNSPNLEVSDTSVSVAKPAHIRTSPPKESLASFWQVPGTGNLCFLTVGVGAIVDILVNLIENDDETASTGITVATCTLGNTYYLALDGRASNKLIPVSLSTTS